MTIFKKFRLGDLVFISILILLAVFLILDPTRDQFIKYTSGNFKLIGGFFKFAIFASMGDLLGLRLKKGKWGLTVGFIPKVIVWGLIGIVITLMFTVYATGIGALQDARLLPYISVDNFGGKLLNAFFISLFMNLTFAPAFMGFHKFTDMYIEGKVLDRENTTAKGTLKKIDWYGFINFIVLKTIPFFWIPAHTITFMLPKEYQVIFAAVLGIALGLLLAIGNKKSK